MKILGQRVYLDMPNIKETKFSVSDETKRQLREEEIVKFERLKVFKASDHPDVKVFKGDEVYVDPMALKRGIIVPIRNGDKVEEKISVSYFDIMHIW